MSSGRVAHVPSGAGAAAAVAPAHAHGGALAGPAPHGHAGPLSKWDSDSDSDGPVLSRKKTLSTKVLSVSTRRSFFDSLPGEKDSDDSDNQSKMSLPCGCTGSSRCSDCPIIAIRIRYNNRTDYIEK